MVHLLQVFGVFLSLTIAGARYLSLILIKQFHVLAQALYHNMTEVMELKQSSKNYSSQSACA